VDQSSDSRRAKKDKSKDKKEKKEKRERDRASRVNLRAGTESDETPRVSGMPIEQILKDFKAADEDRALMKAELQAQVTKRKALEKTLETVQLDLASTKTLLKDQLNRVNELEVALAKLMSESSRQTERIDRMESVVAAKSEAFLGGDSNGNPVEKKKKEGKAVRFSEEPKAPSSNAAENTAMERMATSLALRSRRRTSSSERLAKAPLRSSTRANIRRAAGKLPLRRSRRLTSKTKRLFSVSSRL